MMSDGCLARLCAKGIAGGQASLVLFLGGINLMIIQWVMVRELTMLLLGTEIVVLVVTLAYFAGLSVGYMLAGRIRSSWLPSLGAITLILHLALPILVRLLSGWLYARNAFWLAFILLPLLMPFTVSAFYSILLPHFVDHGQRLIDLYAVELFGAVAGVLVLAGLGGAGLTPLYILYSLLLLVLLELLGLDVRLLGSLALVSTGWLLALPMLDRQSNSYWFGQVFADVFRDGTPTTVFSCYSPYQKVDVLDDVHGQRYLFLNGLIEYGTEDWKRLNVILGKLPAGMIKPNAMVTVGSGSMALEGLAAPYAGHITTVELDPVVLNTSRCLFAGVNCTDQLTNWSYVVDDAKHFFANTTQTFDLVTMNVPAPLTAQTSTLYSASFYASVKAKLNAGGVLAVSLTDRLSLDREVTRRIAAGILANFEQAIVITPESVGITFVFAGNDLPFSLQDVEIALEEIGETSYSVMDTSALKTLTGTAAPITLDRLDVALQESARRIKRLIEPRSER